MSWLPKFIAVAFFVLYFVEKGASVQKLKPIKWATATAKWDEISANCHKHRNGESQKKWDISQLWWRFNTGLCHIRCWIKKVLMWNISRVPLILAPIEMQLLLSRTCTLTSLQFTTSRYTLLHVLTSLLPSASTRPSSAVSKGERDMLVGWSVLVGDTTASKVPTFPNPRNPERQPQALLYLCFVQLFSATVNW